MLTDFNDLYCVAGADEVRRQMEQAREAFRHRAANDAAPDVVEDSSPAPSDEDFPTLSDNSPAPPDNEQGAQSMDRYLLIYGTTDVWDAHEQCKLKKMAFYSVVGREVAKNWYDSPTKRRVHPGDVIKAIAAKQKDSKDQSSGVGVNEALDRFTYLYPSKTVWDHSIRDIVNIEDLKCAMPDLMDIWLRHPERKQILKKNLVFDPTQSVDPAAHINMFAGLPLTPDPDADKCCAIRELSWYLCNGNSEVWEWLIRWLAYPLQHVGAKMATGVLMHSEVHGSGKSFLFDVIMRPIYGDYGATLGQHQMETPYTDWQSRLLYGVFEELFSRDGKHENLGKLKQMITGAKVRIEKKFVSSWEEANHMNSVFLSNEIMPFPLEPSDRRFLVIWPEEKMAETMQERVDYEIRHGGIESFYHWLLRYPLGDFTPHTKPPMTEAKDRLIEFSKPTWEFFLFEWQNGHLDVPYATCAVSQLYEVYKKWCNKSGESSLGRNKLTNLLSRRVPMRKNLHYELSMSERRQQSFFIIGVIPGDKIQAQWLGECYQSFQDTLENSR
jgi:putative DNA primase/helicase